MRILLLANNWVGWQITQWLGARGETIAGVVVHPDDKQKYRDEILRSAGLENACMFSARSLHQPETLAAIRSLDAEIAVSIFFGYILRAEFLNLFSAGCVNLHPALLPYNRGAHPNVWSIIEGTPAGATLHYIDAGVDTGDIIAQAEVEVEAVDTGETLYRRLEHASVELFESAWPSIRAGKALRTAQSQRSGTSHRAKDIERIDEIDLEATYKAKELIDLIRARTFRPYPGAYFRSQGKKIYLHLDLAYEQGTAQNSDG
jgi:methionyl-tRNA formyltransferase